jgi:paraquat-inducible protein B
MNDPIADDRQTVAVPEAIIQHKKGFSVIWVVPIVAALIGAWLAYQAISQRGPTITISFKSAEGLEAGKTPIKYKDVEVGTVDRIQLSDDLTHVLVTARLVKGMEDHLKVDTRFWIVRARVTASEITGIGTLFAGVHIGMDPGKKDESTRVFHGLENPPPVTMDTAGTYYHLRADQLGYLDVGSPIYFRQIQVGQVVGYAMVADATAVDIQIFVRAPYDDQILTSTRFWNTSGINISIEPEGVKINTESLVAMLIGGVAFETPTNLEAGKPVKSGHIFELYSSREKIAEAAYTNKLHFLVLFDEDVRGLKIGAPVEFRGIKIGEVLDIKLELDREEVSFKIPVLIVIEPDRIALKGERTLSGEDLLEKLVEKGLRAQLRTASYLTGQLYINLSIYPHALSRTILHTGRYPELPTIPTPIEEITASLSKIINKLERTPFDQIGVDLRDTIRQMKDLTGSEEISQAMATLNQTVQQLHQFSVNLNSGVMNGINDTLAQTRKTLEEAQKTLITAAQAINQDSPTVYDLRQALKELADAARSIRVMADYLERHPDALIYGKGAK